MLSKPRLRHWPPRPRPTKLLDASRKAPVINVNLLIGRMQDNSIPTLTQNQLVRLRRRTPGVVMPGYSCVNFSLFIPHTVFLSGVARNWGAGVYVLTSPCNFKTCVNVPHVNKTVTDFGGIHTDIPPVATPLFLICTVCYSNVGCNQSTYAVEARSTVLTHRTTFMLQTSVS